MQASMYSHSHTYIYQSLCIHKVIHMFIIIVYSRSYTHNCYDCVFTKLYTYTCIHTVIHVLILNGVVVKSYTCKCIHPVIHKFILIGKSYSYDQVHIFKKSSFNTHVISRGITKLNLYVEYMCPYSIIIHPTRHSYVQSLVCTNDCDC